MKFLLKVILLLLISNSAYAANKGDLKIILTSNLSGRFSPVVEEQEKKDPMVILGQSILYEKKSGANLYLDLGNAFYPGIIAKYSYGSAVMDFFKFTQCSASLISTADLKLGVNSLQFLQKRSRTGLLSANLFQEDKNLFKPFFIFNHRNKKIAFIALTSSKIFLDIAEKNIYQVKVKDEEKVIRELLPGLKKISVDYIIILSGLDDKKNLSLLNKFNEIDLIISGGDRSSGLFDEKIVRFDTWDNRSVVAAYKGSGYYILNLDFDKNLKVRNYIFKPAVYKRIDNENYREFIKRLTRWKEHYKNETGRVVVQTKKAFDFEVTRVTNLMRDKYNTEIAIILKNAIKKFKVGKEIKETDIISAVNDNYPVFIFRLSGKNLSQIKPLMNKFHIEGYKKGRIQGYDVSGDRLYRIAATQTVFEMIRKALGKEIPYNNTWKNISNIILDDLKKEKILLKDDFNYIDRRFRMTVDISLSNFFEKSKLKNKDEIDVPPGSSEKSYNRWGIEDKIDFTFYNRYHRIILTPYIYYIKEEENYIHNLLRGTLFYNLNLDYLIKPYHKSQIETVVSEVDGKRPTMNRETIGGNIKGDILTGKVGFGFEKKIHDPKETLVYGFETIFTLSFNFFDYFTYFLKLDSFVSFKPLGKVTDENGYIRAELENQLSFKVSELIGFSIKHKYFYYYQIEQKNRFNESQFFVSLDLKTDFKIY